MSLLSKMKTIIGSTPLDIDGSRSNVECNFDVVVRGINPSSSTLRSNRVQF